MMNIIEDTKEEIKKLKSFNGNLHLAIFIEPYLSYIISGKKKVESRFSINKCAPFGKVKKGDIVLIKKSGGPIVGYCKVEDVWYYKLDSKSFNDIKDNYSDLLCVEDSDFWEERKRSSYATLIRLTNFQQISPIQVIKKDRRGWVVLKNDNQKLQL